MQISSLFAAAQCRRGGPPARAVARRRRQVRRIHGLAALDEELRRAWEAFQVSEMTDGGLDHRGGAFDVDLDQPARP